MWKDYEHILVEEEIYWKQQSRCKWINFGDKNSSYFHRISTNRWRRNRILMLIDENGEWIDNQIMLRNMGVDFLRKLYEEDSNYE